MPLLYLWARLAGDNHTIIIRQVAKTSLSTFQMIILSLKEQDEWFLLFPHFHTLKMWKLKHSQARSMVKSFPNAQWLHWILDLCRLTQDSRLFSSVVQYTVVYMCWYIFRVAKRASGAGLGSRWPLPLMSSYWD